MLEQVAEKLQRPQLPDREDAERFVRKYISYCTKGNNEFFVYGHDGTQLSFIPGKPVRSLVGAANWVYEKVRPSALLSSALLCSAPPCAAQLGSALFMPADTTRSAACCTVHADSATPLPGPQVAANVVVPEAQEARNEAPNQQVSAPSSSSVCPAGLPACLLTLPLTLQAPAGLETPGQVRLQSKGAASSGAPPGELALAHRSKSGRIFFDARPYWASRNTPPVERGTCIRTSAPTARG